MSRRIEPTPAREASLYERHLASDRWRRSAARLGELSLAANRCRLCGRGPPEAAIEVHHRSYERLGRERASDLCTLCRECHGFVTAELRRRRYAARPIPLPGDTSRKSPTVPFADTTTACEVPANA